MGFDPYPGTLNLKLTGEEVEKKKLLEKYLPISINGFDNGTRSYGSVSCWRALVNGKVGGAVILALRTHYGEDVIEIISPNNIRNELGLKDGDKVEITILDLSRSSS